MYNKTIPQIKFPNNSLSFRFLIKQLSTNVNATEFQPFNNTLDFLSCQKFCVKQQLKNAILIH